MDGALPRISACNRTKKAAAEFGDKVEVEMIDTFNKETFNEWGVPDSIYIDGKKVRTGPPPSMEKLRKTIKKKVDRL